MRSLVLLSGGMDSATALVKMIKSGDEVETISFNYGSKHNAREHQHALKLCAHYGVKNTLVRLPFVDELFKSDLLSSGGDIPHGHYADESMKKTVVPFRNGIMVSIAAGYAESIGFDQVVLSNHSGDHAIYPDCRSEFKDVMGLAVQYGTDKKVKLHSPFSDIDKTSIAKIGGLLEVRYDLTWSCYEGGDTHCGKCGTCYERKEAFRDAGIKDPTRYAG